MQYVSTRGKAPTLGFDEVLLAGLASDGGLYVPQLWPHFTPQTWQALAGHPYAAVAKAVLKEHQPYEGLWPNDFLPDRVAEAKARFAQYLERATDNL